MLGVAAAAARAFNALAGVRVAAVAVAVAAGAGAVRGVALVVAAVREGAATGLTPVERDDVGRVPGVVRPGVGFVGDLVAATPPGRVTGVETDERGSDGLDGEPARVADDGGLDEAVAEEPGAANEERGLAEFAGVASVRAGVALTGLMLLRGSPTAGLGAVRGVAGTGGGGMGSSSSISDSCISSSSSPSSTPPETIWIWLGRTKTPCSGGVSSK